MNRTIEGNDDDETAIAIPAWFWKLNGAVLGVMLAGGVAFLSWFTAVLTEFRKDIGSMKTDVAVIKNQFEFANKLEIRVEQYRKETMEQITIIRERQDKVRGDISELSAELREHRDNQNKQ